MTDILDNAAADMPSAHAASAAPTNPDFRWYVVHAYSGLEKAVERNIRERIARADLPAKTVAQLVDAARAKPMDFMFGSGGQGSSAHLATELFLSVTGTKMTHVPYKGVAAAIAEVIAGRLDISIASLASGMPHVRSGRVQGFGVSGKERSALLPQVPTFAEQGFGDYNMSYWWGVAAPAGTPAAVLQRLNQEIAKAAEKPRLRDSFIAQGARAVTSTAAEQSRRVDDEIRVWKATIQKANIKLE